MSVYVLVNASNDNYLAEILEKMGGNSPKESECELNSAFSKFAIITRDLSGLMKHLVRDVSNNFRESLIISGRFCEILSAIFWIFQAKFVENRCHLKRQLGWVFVETL